MGLTSLGGFLFRHRDAVPVPFAVAVAASSDLLHSRRGAGVVLAGFLLLLLGLALRFWAVCYIGPRSRSRGGGPEFRTAGGPYASMKHPLYVGNGILSEGLLLLSGAGYPRLPALFPLLAFAFYAPIVAWEKGMGRHRNLPVSREMFGWRVALRSERRTYQSVAAFLLTCLISGFVRTRAAASPR